jgi:hypothetical protein
MNVPDYGDMTVAEMLPLMAVPKHRTTELMVALMAGSTRPERDEAILTGRASRIAARLAPIMWAEDDEQRAYLEVFSLDVVRRSERSMPGPGDMDPDQLATACEPPYTLDPDQYRAGADLLCRELGASSDIQRAFVHRIAKDELFQLLVDLTLIEPEEGS